MSGYGAQDLRNEINAILLDLNTQITAIAGIIQFAEETGQRVTALDTHSVEVINAGAQLMNNGTAVQHLRDAMNAYKALVSALEYYRDYLI